MESDKRRLKVYFVIAVVLAFCIFLAECSSPLEDEKLEVVIEEIDASYDIEPEGTRIVDGRTTFLLPDKWEQIDQPGTEVTTGEVTHQYTYYRTGVDDLVRTKNTQAVLSTKAAHIIYPCVDIGFHSVHANYRDYTRAQTKNRKDIHLVVNGKEWEGYHGILPPPEDDVSGRLGYSGSVSTTIGSAIIEVHFYNDYSKGFSVTSEDFLTFLATLEFTGWD